MATFPGVSTVKVPGLEVPIDQFGSIFYASFLGVVIYYLKIVTSIETLFVGANNKNDLRFQISTHSGILSPFSESATGFGRALDILGFVILIGAWWVAFEVGRRLFINNHTFGFGEWLISMMPWISVVLGIFALFTVRRAMEEFSTSKVLYIFKLLCACLSLPIAWLIARSL
jgi:hypothetical protein